MAVSAEQWYAARVHSWSKIVLRECDKLGIRVYHVDALHNLYFFHASKSSLYKLKELLCTHMFFYLNPLHTFPQPISEKEMSNFIIVTSAGDKVYELNAAQIVKYRNGERVRVISGPFKGAEGVVLRIKGDRRLVVEVTGVAIVATTFVHPSLLEKIGL